jgi:hypothetical protein
MNSYSLAADSRRWWWLPATAGALGTAAVTAILVVPATGTAPPVAPPTSEVGVGSGTIVERPCYLARPGWNTDRGWEQPVCTTSLRGRVTNEEQRLNRVAPGYLP